MSEEFRKAMADAGINYGGNISPDGKLVRFKHGKDKGPDTWFILFNNPDRSLVGIFGNWSSGLHETWHNKNGSLTKDEQQRLREQIAKAREEHRKQVQELQAKARQRAEWIVGHSEPVTSSNCYLKKKGVRPAGELTESRGALVVPLRDITGRLHSVQFIQSDGSKKFLTGGRIQGCFFTIHDAGGTLVICEGIATGLSIHEATGLSVIAAMNCGNLKTVAGLFRTQFPQREIIIAADNDTKNPDKNPGLEAGREAAKAIGAKLTFPQFKDATMKGTDFNDLHTQEGIEEVIRQIENGEVEKETIDETLARLSKLSPIDYDRCREAEAAKLEIRVSTLDEEVFKLHPKGSTPSNPDGELQPWETPVDGGELLDEIAATIRRFVVVPECATSALALYVLNSYVTECFSFCAVVLVTSPEPACGKGRVLDVLERLCRNAFRTANTSAPVLYHTIESSDGKVSLLIDEIDSQTEDQREAITNIVKHGIEPSGRATRMEKEGEKQVVKKFKTYGPKVCAAIGLKCFDKATVSRSVVIEMRKKKKHEKTEKFRKYSGLEIQRKCLRWAADNAETLRNAPDIKFPESSRTDRHEDVWEPLLQIAALCGSGWTTSAWEACDAFTGDNVRTIETKGHTLLADCWEIVRNNPSNVIFSADLASALNGLPDADYSRMSGGAGISQAYLATQLEEYQIFPDRVRNEAAVQRRGYEKWQFEEAAEAYLSSGTSIQGVTVSQTPARIEDSLFSKTVTENNCDTLKNGQKPNNDSLCDTVTVENPKTSQKNGKTLKKVSQPMGEIV